MVKKSLAMKSYRSAGPWASTVTATATCAVIFLSPQSVVEAWALSARSATAGRTTASRLPSLHPSAASQLRYGPCADASTTALNMKHITKKRRRQGNTKVASSSLSEEWISASSTPARTAITSVSSSSSSSQSIKDYRTRETRPPTTVTGKGSLFDDLQSHPNQFVWESTIAPILTASLLITGNTVGAGMLVLPDLVAGPGMAISTTIFAGAFLLNWISGLLIAQIAITQHAMSGSDVPSSFKEFAQANLPTTTTTTMTTTTNTLVTGSMDSSTSPSSTSSSPWVAVTISGISILVNALVLAFNTAKIGDFGVETLHKVTAMTAAAGVGTLPADATPSAWFSLAWIVTCVLVAGTQSFANLSTIASLLVAGLFGSFAGLLLPGLARMETSPIDLLLHTPGTSSDILASACQLAPIVLMSLVYQNIVPTVTKMLDYDRSKSIAAISLGSFLPLVMYVAWAFCVVGGGIDGASLSSGGVGGSSLLSLFTFTTIAGSSIGCIMSLAEEFDSFEFISKMIGNDGADGTYTAVSNAFADSSSSSSISNGSNDKFSLPSVLLSVASVGVALTIFKNDLNGALKVAGSFGSPLLYGVLPVLMAHTQSKARGKMDQLPKPPSPISPLELPTASVGLLGVASTGFVGNELLQSAQEFLAGAVAMAAAVTATATPL